jgi:hypothetical protein
VQEDGARKSSVNKTMQFSFENDYAAIRELHYIYT